MKIILRLFAAGTLPWLASALLTGAGELTPPGPPGPTMKALDEVEPRIPIHEVPFLINSPGSYYLAHNLGPVPIDTNGIVIEANNVSIDLAGFSIFGAGAGAGGSGTGILVNGTYTNIAIINGSIRNWRLDGINAALAENGRLVGLQSSHNGNAGLRAGNNMLVLDNASLANMGHGLTAVTGTLMRGNTTQMNGGDGIQAVYGCILENNICTFNDGDGVEVGDYGHVRNNTCDHNGNNGFGGGIHATGDRNSIEDNVCSANDSGLILEGENNLVARNLLVGNVAAHQLSPGNQLEMVISELPAALDMPGYYRVAGRLYQSQVDHDGIIISANNVTLDLGGQALVGPGKTSGGTATGIFLLAQSNITIRNGSVRDWPRYGILVSGDNIRIEKVNAHNNGDDGISLAGEAVSATGNHCSANGGNGMHVSGPALVMENTFTNNAAAGLTTSVILKGEAWTSGANVRHNVSSCNAYGIVADHDALIEHNTVHFNAYNGIQVGRGCRVVDNACNYNGYDNEAANIQVDSISSTIEDNLVNGGYYGIKVTSAGNYIASNRATHNHTDYSFVSGNTTGGGDLANVSF